jgi:hypothetical protein
MTVNLACGSAGGSEGTNTVRDSAGITIVETHSAAWGPGEEWRLADGPGTVIGGSDEEPGQVLFQANSAFRLPDGRIVVGDNGTSEIRFFDERGGFLEAVGGKGEGPGEFRMLELVARYGSDSIIAWDRRGRRISVFDRDGNFSRTTTPNGMGYQAKLFFPDGTLLASDMRTLYPGPGAELPLDAVVRRTREFGRFGTDGAEWGTLGTFPDDENWSSYDVDHPHVQWYLFGKRTVMAGTGSTLWVGTGEAYELRGYDRDGNWVKSIRNAAYEPRRTRGSDLANRVAELEAGWDDANLHMAAVFQGQNPPEFIAPYDDLVADIQNHLWVRRYQRPGEPCDTWDVFDPDGRMLGSVEVPYGLTVLDIGADYVLGSALDELQIERIEFYRLVKP